MHLPLRILLAVSLIAVLLPRQVGYSQVSGLAVVNVDTTQPGLSISPTFLGFSHEWNSAQQLIGPPSAPNPIYRQLVQNLLSYGGGPLVVRVGGNSTDSTGPPQPGVVDPFAQLYTDLGTQFILGVNLGSNNLALVTTQTRAYLQGMPSGSVVGIEIGNEPDLYHQNGHRPSTYSDTDYAHEFKTWQGAIQPLLPAGVGLIGPSWSSAASLRNLPGFLDQQGGYLAVVSQHWYAGTQCNGRTNPADYLLRPQAARSGASAVASSVELAHQRGLPFRMGEMNSISCGGETGVSDVFASALWATDMLFEFAKVGVDGVNIHNGNGGGYALFTFSNGADGYSLTSVRPEYYGLLLFQQAAPAGAKMLPVTLNTSKNVTAWATLDDSGSVRVVVLNKDESANGDVDVQVGGAAGQANLLRLAAPSLDATTGITLGGQSFDGSSDGTLQGSTSLEGVASAQGSYSFSMPPVSAALLTLTAPD